jgi:hypothetical protein
VVVVVERPPGPLKRLEFSDEGEAPPPPFAACGRRGLCPSNGSGSIPIGVCHGLRHVRPPPSLQLVEAADFALPLPVPATITVGWHDEFPLRPFSRCMV